MLHRKAFKFRLKTNRKIDNQSAQFAGSCRFVWNKALALQKGMLEKKEGFLGYTKLCQLLLSWKEDKETKWLADCPSQPLQQVLKNLDRAVKDAFNKKIPKKFPVFKKKGHHDSFRYPQGVKLDGDRIFLPKIGFVKFFKSREIVGTIKNATVSHSRRHWFVSIQTEQKVEKKVHPSKSIVGIDVGIKRFATLSDGTVHKPLKHRFKKLAKKLAFAQKTLSRRTKGSKNFRKQKAKIATIHQKIANARLDYLHKTSTTISKNHAVVVLEDLKVANMSKSAKGTKEDPGKNVKAKAGLNRSILDQGWHTFKQLLGYKLDWLGGELIVVDARHTSQRCCQCGHIAKENRITQASFLCVQCQYVENADLNAARNILTAGHAVLACGDTRLYAA